MKKKVAIYSVITALFLVFLLQNDKIMALASSYALGSIADGTILNIGDTIVHPYENDAMYPGMIIKVTIEGTTEVFNLSTSSGKSYTLLDGSGGYSETTLLKNYLTTSKKKITKFTVESTDVNNYKIALVATTESLPSYTITYSKGDGTTDATTVIYEGEILTFPDDTSVTDGRTFMGWRESGSSTIYKKDDTLTNITKAYQFQAYWVNTPAGGNVGSGEYYLDTGTPYTATLGSGYKVNGGSDQCVYQGNTFYIPTPGVYTLSK